MPHAGCGVTHEAPILYAADPVNTMRRSEGTTQQDLRSLFETSRILISSPDQDEVLRHLLRVAMSSLLATRGVVLLYSSQKARYRVAMVRGLPALARVGPITLRTPAANEPLLLNEVPTALREHGVALVLVVRYQDEHIGLVGLGANVTGRPYDKADLRFVQSLVEISAAAIHNLKVVAELKQSNRDLKQSNRDLDYRVQQLNTLFELSQEFNAAPERSRVMRLFSFALMGQMMVRRHLFFLQRSGPAFDVISRQNVPSVEFPSAFFDDVSGPTQVDDPQSSDLARTTLRRHGLVLALPIKQQGAVRGLLCLGPKMTGKPYESGEKEFLYSLGAMAVVSIQNADLVDERIEKERLEEELRLARDIQQGLLPSVIPQVQGLQIATMALPSREVGGDYFDVLALRGGRYHLIVADVTGKGMPAALLMSSIHACTHIMLPMRLPLEECVRHINRVIYENTPADKFITAFAAVYEAASKRLFYVNAGHEPPLLIRADGTIAQLEAGGLLLGILPEVTYLPGSVTMAPGDIVVMFTDGVTEAMGDAGEEYTDRRLQAFAARYRDRSAHRLLDMIQEDVERFTGPVAALSDDRTMVILKAEESTP